MIFGTGSAKFEFSGSEVLLEHSNLYPNWDISNIGRTVSIYDHYTTYDNFGSYAEFTVELNLFKYDDPTIKFNEVYPYLYKTVYFWPHVDAPAASASSGQPLTFFIKNMQHRYHSSDYVNNDILEITFSSLDYVDVSSSIAPSYTFAEINYGYPFLLAEGLR